jgi:hypothetical protein
MKNYRLFLFLAILLLLIVPLISASWFSDFFGTGKAVTTEDSSVATDDSQAVQKSGITKFFESIFGGTTENSTRNESEPEPGFKCPVGCICDDAGKVIECEKNGSIGLKNIFNNSGLFTNNAWLGIGRYNNPLLYVSADADRVDFNGAAPKFWNGLEVHNVIKALNGIEFVPGLGYSYIGLNSWGYGGDYDWAPNDYNAVFTFRNQPEAMFSNYSKPPMFAFDFGGEMPYMIITKSDLGSVANWDVPLIVARDGVLFGGPAVASEDLIVLGSAAFENKQIELNEGTIQLHQLSGSGNAYACLNSIGVLFRSSVPCIQVTKTI